MLLLIVPLTNVNVVGVGWGAGRRLGGQLWPHGPQTECCAREHE